MFSWSEVIGTTCAELEKATGVSWDVWNTGGGCQAFGPLGFDTVLNFVRDSFVLWGLAVAS